MARLPPHIMTAALRSDRAQDLEVVRSWIADETHDVNATHNGQSLLSYVTSGTITAAKADLVQRLLARGANPNTLFHYLSPLNCVARGIGEDAPAAASYLIAAGADVEFMAVRTPLGHAICHEASEIVTLLLRAGASLDNIQWDRPHQSAEQVIAEREQRYPRIAHLDLWRMLKSTVRGMREAGGWDAYERKFRRGTLPRFRTLVVRGRATTSDPLLAKIINLPQRPLRFIVSYGP